MRVFGNIIWLILGGGFFLALGWLVAGMVMMLTVIGIPFGIAAFRLAQYSALPFGNNLVDAEVVGYGRIPGTMMGNFLWIVLAGLWLAISHALSACYCLLTCTMIVTIPVALPCALAHMKLAEASFAPLGKRIVSTDLARMARMWRFAR